MQKTHLSGKALVEMVLPKVPLIWSAGCELLRSVYNTLGQNFPNDSKIQGAANQMLNPEKVVEMEDAETAIPEAALSRRKRKIDISDF